MATVHDVARYILDQQDEMDTWKLQKLVYYCQAWHLVWDDEPLFHDRIEAWANGPVVPRLYQVHRGRYRVDSWPHGKVANLTKPQRESVDVVLGHYGWRTGAWLRELTHREPPWKDARKGLAPGERGNREITLDALVDHYGAL